MGYSPTLVSPESITASAPSRTALATSEASARVGAGLVIIDSSIWVATMTGLALSRALLMTSFCRNGTSSSGHSTPRSPRATMNASKASDDLVEVVDRLRLLDLRDHGDEHALLAHHLADRLDVLGRAHERQRHEVDGEVEREPQVLDVLLREGRDADRDPGQVEALVVADPSRRSSPRSRTSWPSTSTTVSRTLPSSTRIGSPGPTSPGQPVVRRPADRSGPRARRAW